MPEQSTPSPTQTWNTAANEAPTENAPRLDAELAALLDPPQQPDEVGRLGPYRVLGLLGQGGMGVVFRADDPQAGRPVAVKLMRPALASSPQMSKRFLREARAVAQLDHEHVVPLYHVGEASVRGQPVPFLVMPLLRGETLSARLRREGRLSPDEVIRLGAQLAAALVAAHAAGLIHRDVKPANVWLEQRPDEPVRARLFDFGLARGDQSDPLTQTGVVVGTVGYTAPEQAAGQPLDARADLFSLGCVLHVMATAKAPFAIPAAQASRHALAHLPRPTSDLILRMLSHDPDGRPASAREVLQCLQTPSPVSPQRRRWPLLLAGAAAVLAVAVILPLIFREKPENHPVIDPVTPPSPALVAKDPVTPPSPPAPVVSDDPLDVLSRDAIDEEALKIAGDGDPKKAPVGLVAILGDGRLRFWSRPKRFPERLAVDASVDGRFVAVGDPRGRVRVWEVATGKLVHVLDTGAAEVTCLALTRDGGRLAAGTAGGQASWWDVRTGKSLGTVVTKADALTDVAFSPDGEHLVTAGDVVQAWRTADRQLIVIDGDLSTAGERLAFSPSGKSLAVWSPSGRTKGVRVFHLPTAFQAAVPKGKPALHGVLPPPEPNAKVSDAHVCFAAWGKDATLLVSCRSRHRTAVWDVPTAKRLHDLEQHALTFGADLHHEGKQAALSYFHLIDLHAVEKRQKIGGGKGHTGTVLFVKYVANGTRIVSAALDGSVRLWATRTNPNEKPLPRFVGEERSVLPDSPSSLDAAVFSPDGKRLYLSANNSMIDDYRFGEKVPRRARRIDTLPHGGYSGRYCPLAIDSEGKRLAWGSLAQVYVRDLSGNDPPGKFSSGGGDVATLGFTADGRSLVVATRAPQWAGYLMDLPNNRSTMTLKLQQPSDYLIEARPGRAEVVVTHPQRDVTLYDVTTGQSLRPMAGSAPAPTALAFGGDGKRLAVGNASGNITIHDVEEGRRLISFQTTGGVQALGLRPDGTVLAVAGSDGRVRLYDDRGRPLTTLDVWPDGIIRQVLFSPKGSHLVTVNGNDTAYVYRLAALSREGEKP